MEKNNSAKKQTNLYIFHYKNNSDEKCAVICQIYSYSYVNYVNKGIIQLCYYSIYTNSHKFYLLKLISVKIKEFTLYE